MDVYLHILGTEWVNFEEKLKSLPLAQKNARSFVRFFLSGAVECEIDKHGRFLIPANLREHANLDKEIVIIGVGTRLEIWNRETWQKYSKDESISADCVNTPGNGRLFLHRTRVDLAKKKKPGE